MAAGLELERPRLDDFRAAFNACVRDFAGGRTLLPVQKIDAWIELAEADERLAGELAPLRPFGCANATPVWGVRQVRLAGRPRTVGKGHLKFSVTVGHAVREAIAFNRTEESLPDGPMDLAFQLKQDTYMGREQLTLNVQDVRPSEAVRTGS
jgi:single-stranded-DNA-specific exonuclease